jgi:hypothetical protein
MTEDNKRKLKSMELDPNSNVLDNLRPISLEPETPPTSPTKLGEKSSELIRLQEQRKMEQLLLSNPNFSINQFIATATNRRRELEIKEAENVIKFQQKKAIEQAARREQEKVAAAKHIAELEAKSPSMRDRRLQEEQTKLEERQRILDQIVRQKKKAIEACEVYFNLPTSKFAAQYENNAISVLSDSPVQLIVTSRAFGTDRFGSQKYAYRCSICGYSFEESLSLSNIHRHIYEQSDRHLPALIAIIEKEYTQKINEKHFEFKHQDDPDIKDRRLSDEIERLKKIKGKVFEH